MVDNDDLLNALQLRPLVESPIPFVQFLTELGRNRHLADTAPAVVLRAIMSMGEEDIENEPDLERKQFLITLKSIGIRSWKAFYRCCGTQRFAEIVFKRYLEPAADGGAQSRKFLVIEGGSGSGKDFFKDCIKEALEKFGVVHAVKGCPVHESPLNLLRLLEEESLPRVAAAIGMSLDDFMQLMAFSSQPCDHCFEMAMRLHQESTESLTLAGFEVERVRLSPRTFGIAEWQPGQKCSLVSALRRGNRGIVSMPDAFIKRRPVDGQSDERLVLLDASEYRRVPNSEGCSLSESTFAPLDVLVLATTNSNAYSAFLNDLPDKEAFTGRGVNLRLNYNLVGIEEERAYKQELARYSPASRAQFGPLALRMIATLAVISRYEVPSKNEPFIDPISRMRLLQGEHLTVKLRTGSDWGDCWGTDNTVEAKATRADDDQASGRKSLKDVPVSAITPALVWSMVGPDEGNNGLDMRLMLGILSRINRFGVTKEGRVKRVSALEAIALLRSVIAAQSANSTNLTPQQKAVFERCQKWLGGYPLPGQSWSEVASANPQLIEWEYRRLLKKQVLAAFCPDFESRAQRLFDEYVLHAVAWSSGESKFRHPELGEIPLNESNLDDLDRYRLGKTSRGSLSDTDKKFRKSVQFLISERKDEEIEAQLTDLDKQSSDYRERRKRLSNTYKASWTVIPDLANAIKAKLNHEIGSDVARLLSTEVVSNLANDELKRLEEAKRILFDLGYSEDDLSEILDYSRKVKIWSHAD